MRGRSATLGPRKFRRERASDEHFSEPSGRHRRQGLGAGPGHRRRESEGQKDKQINAFRWCGAQRSSIWRTPVGGRPPATRQAFAPSIRRVGGDLNARTQWGPQSLLAEATTTVRYRTEPSALSQDRVRRCPMREKLNLGEEKRMLVVVIGAGYAGTMAANRLVRKADVEVTVVNPRPEFVERVRLHEYIAGSGAATVPLTDMLDPKITLVVGSADLIDNGSVLLDDGATLAFDYLVYAAGGSIDEPEGTVAVGSLASAERARAELAALDDDAVVTVVGGGLTGVETAAEIAEARPTLRVHLLSESEIGPR